MTFRQLDEHVNAVANYLVAQGVQGGDGVAILARNHRWFVIAFYGCARVGARMVLMNTDFAGPQIGDVAKREGAEMLIYDDEYAAAVAQTTFRLGKLRTLGFDPDSATGSTGTDRTLADIVRNGSSAPAPKPSRRAMAVILTSGTTGTPKGAPRPTPPTLQPVGGVLSRAPFQAREITYVATPLFHGLGLIHGTLALMMGSTLLLSRKFEPSDALDAIEQHRPTAFIVVPVMLSRVLDRIDAAERSIDTSSLRIVYSSGAQLGPELARRSLRTLGPIIYNMYGSTEISNVSIADPADLAADPATVGRPIRGVRVSILDDDDNELPSGATGRIFVTTPAVFKGYSDGGTKATIDGKTSTGDVGYLDQHGRLFVTGRDDEMIVSGGENVFPAEVESLLGGHPDITEAAAIGVDDEQYGARLRAFVVRRQDCDINEQTVKTYVRDNLARYKVPREVIFVSELPRNATGKLVKRKLRELQI